MKKRMLIMLMIVGLLFGGIFGFQFFKNYMIKKFIASNKAPVVTVSAMKVGYQAWQPKIKASGSLRALQGVDVTTAIAGIVRNIYFMPGAEVKEGAVLLQLDADAEKANLDALKASAELAASVYKRDKAQFAIHAISKAALDFDAADLKNKQAAVEQQAFITAKKTISAPFTGRLGISAANLGQYLNPGDKVVTLQSLDPIYVDFYVPQQSLVQVGVDQPITITSNTYPDKVFTGKIFVVEPKVDPATRNVQVEAIVSNPQFELLPGMFASVEVTTGQPQQYLTLPQTAVSFNPYGEVAYVVKETGKDTKNNPVLTAVQTFVEAGETRGDQVVILKGLKEGDLVVTSGQLKLQNGSQVLIDNSVVPENNAAPKPVDK